jgi:hypothetical protein
VGITAGSRKYQLEKAYDKDDNNNNNNNSNNNNLLAFDSRTFKNPL